MLASSASVVALVKKMTKPNTKTLTRTVSIPKKNHQTACSANDVVRTAIKPISYQKPLSNQQGNRDKR
jgi:hypothetical protein